MNNLNLILPLLHFEDKTTKIIDTFYFVQIILRKKDKTSAGGSKENVIKSYYITSANELEKQLVHQIIPICDALRARAYIHLNPRSFKKIAHNLSIANAVYIKDGAYSSLRKSYQSTCSKFPASSKKKLWFVDIDFPAIGVFDFEPLFRSDAPAVTFMAHIPTPNGYHLITAPFNTAQLYITVEKDQWEFYPQVHKNSPTILYYPDM